MGEAATGRRGKKNACCSALMDCNKCSLAGTCCLFNGKGESGFHSSEERGAQSPGLCWKAAEMEEGIHLRG